jgi:hypothetical protein
LGLHHGAQESLVSSPPRVGRILTQILPDANAPLHRAFEVELGSKINSAIAKPSSDYMSLGAQ